MTRELIRLKDGPPVGELADGVFVQRVQGRHIYNAAAGKGMDKFVHFQLKVKHCRTWRLDFKDTKQVLEIPFAKVESYPLKKIRNLAGEQYLVPFEDFQEVRAVIQPNLV